MCTIIMHAYTTLLHCVYIRASRSKEQSQCQVLGQVALSRIENTRGKNCVIHHQTHCNTRHVLCFSFVGILPQVLICKSKYIPLKTSICTSQIFFHDTKKLHFSLNGFNKAFKLGDESNVLNPFFILALHMCLDGVQPAELS